MLALVLAPVPPTPGLAGSVGPTADDAETRKEALAHYDAVKAPREA